MTTEDLRANQRQQNTIETSLEDTNTNTSNNIDTRLEREESSKTTSIPKLPVTPVAIDVEHVSLENTELGTAVATTDVSNSTVHDDQDNETASERSVTNGLNG